MNINNEINILYNEKEIKKALEILEIKNNEINKLNKNIIRSKYLKLALKYHPDKNNNNIEYKIKFQEINDSYNLIIDKIYKNNEKENKNEENNLINIFLIFIKKFIINYEKKQFYEIYENIDNNNKSFIEIIKNIIIDLFFNDYVNELEKEKLLEIYSILNKYKLFFKISNETLEKIKLIIREKYKETEIYIINPTLDLMLENNFYKLVLNDEIFLIPLWHNELHYKNKDNNCIIVLIQPNLDNNINIDDNNNIIITKLLKTDDLKNLINNNLVIELYNLNLEIPSNKLNLKKIQYYTFKNKGLSKIDENNIYNIKNKGDIIVKIIIEL